MKKYTLYLLLSVLALTQQLFLQAYSASVNQPLRHSGRKRNAQYTRVSPASTEEQLLDQVALMLDKIDRYDLQKAKAVIKCNDAHEFNMYQDLKHNPSAAFFYDIAMTVFYDAIGCTTSAKRRLADFEHLAGKQDVRMVFHTLREQLSLLNNLHIEHNLLEVFQEKRLEQDMDNITKIKTGTDLIMNNIDTLAYQGHAVSTNRGNHYQIRSKRGADRCSDPAEEKAYNVIQWIPIISFFYSFATSIHYGIKNCHEKASERAIDMAIDIGTDLAVAVTGGAAGALAYGGKTAAKVGIKLGVKAATKAAKAAIKAPIRSATKALQQLAKQGIRGTLKQTKSIVKANIKTLVGAAKNVPKAAKSIPKAVKSIPKAVSSQSKAIVKKAREGVQKVSSDGLLKSTKDGAKAIGKRVKVTVKKGVDDLAQQAQRNIDKSSKSKNVIVKSGDQQSVRDVVHCIVKRVAGVAGGCEVRKSKVKQGQEPQKRPRQTDLDDNSANILREDFKKKTDDAWQHPRRDQLNKWIADSNQDYPFTYFHGKVHFEGKVIKIPTDKNPQHAFECLQQYFDANIGNTPGKKGALKVEMELGGYQGEFVIFDTANPNSPHPTVRQVFIKDVPPKETGTKFEGYVGIAETLSGDKVIDQARAEAIYKAIKGQTDTAWRDLTVQGEKVFNEDQMHAAFNLAAITQIAEAVPPNDKFRKILLDITKKEADWIGEKAGRVPGSDSLARHFLRQIGQEKGLTFKDVFGHHKYMSPKKLEKLGLTKADLPPPPKYVAAGRGGLHKQRKAVNAQNKDSKGKQDAMQSMSHSD